jgi:hypothetical protein
MTTPLASVPREPYKVMPGGETVYLLRPEASPIAWLSRLVSMAAHATRTAWLSTRYMSCT